jgi:transcriptional regulator with XRE-family HTH domain
MNKLMRQRIKELREKRGWSMRELAARANTTSSTINKLEKGLTRLNTDWLTRLAAALEVEPQELITPSDREPPPIQQDDVELYEGGLPYGLLNIFDDRDKEKDAEYLKSRFAKQSRYMVKSSVLDQIGITTNSIIISDASPEEINRIKTGNIVIAELRENGRKVTILRQFLAPSILVANSSMPLPPVINMRLQDATIKAVVVASIHSHMPESVMRQK